MHFKNQLLASTIMIMFGNTIANAADGTITFNGTVTDSACSATTSVMADKLESGPSVSATLTLPPVTAATLSAKAGTYVGQTPFSILLTGCEAVAGLNIVRVLFTTASSPSNDANVMANIAMTSPASDVAIAIMREDGTTQVDLNGGTNVDPGTALPESEGPITLNYKAAYKSLSTNVQPGNITGVADFVISYF
ncbi:type 1 fimbrial protein [Pluralibacter gergoviae]|uniref:fimbrial protein n=1 Tax=Pluralibacter gergoviae TaxID=61647 RepID=UPI0028813040|nr:type 1 fimbrial protein [Pluralibacter gergoviae]ELK5593992.1 type 1 fimbrial protein [Pluralibacter gergoviae]MDU4432612.1 fimbrial protein [Pluralibacter gergoviae]